MRATLGLALALLVGACGSAAPPSAPTSTPQPTAVATPPPATATPTAPPAASSAEAERIVERLDELGLLVELGDGDATGTWAVEEGNWLNENFDSLMAQDLGDYVTNMLAFLTAVSDGTDQTASVNVLLAMRNEIATAYGIETAVVPTAAPTPAATPKPVAVSYKKLMSRAWAQVVKSPDNYIGKGYVLWACINQFDAATGPGAFLANASYKAQEYWFLDGENTWFEGAESKLAPFVENDMVSMNVVSQGSYSYDTQAGGNTTVPKFEIKSIKRRGSCE